MIIGTLANGGKCVYVVLCLTDSEHLKARVKRL